MSVRPDAHVSGATRLRALGRAAKDAYGFLHIGPSAMACTLPLAGAATASTVPSAERLLALLPVAVSFHLFAFLLNDVCDLEVDRTQPLRARDPLVRGVISPGAVLVIALAQLPISFAATALLGGGAAAHSTLALAFVSMAIYDVWGKRSVAPLLLDLIQGIGWGALTVFGALMSGGPTVASFILATGVVAFIMMTNGIHGPLRDLTNDLRHGAKTTAALLGARPLGDGIAVSGPWLAAYAASLQVLLLILSGIATSGLVGAAPSAVRWAVAALGMVTTVLLAWGLRTLRARRAMIISGTLYILLTLALLIVPFVFRLDRTGAFVVGLAYTAPLAALVMRHGWSDA